MAQHSWSAGVDEVERVTAAIAKRETPGPIPNPEVKPFSADGTATERLWESRTPPDIHLRQRPPGDRWPLLHLCRKQYRGTHRQHVPTSEQRSSTTERFPSCPRTVVASAPHHEVAPSRLRAVVQSRPPGAGPSRIAEPPSPTSAAGSRPGATAATAGTHVAAVEGPPAAGIIAGAL